MDIEPPIAYVDLRSLFERLDRVSSSGYECDHAFTQTTRFLEERNLRVAPMLSWLGQNGAGCDCEVMFNVAQQWEERVGYGPDE